MNDKTFEQGMEDVIDDIDIMIDAAEEARKGNEANDFWYGLAIFVTGALAIGGLGYALGNANGFKEGFKDGVNQFNPNNNKK